MILGEPRAWDEISLYFHIPFCSRKCDYCHFFVLPNKEPLKKQFFDALKKEWQLRKSLLEGKQVTSVYFGGGTPFLLGPKLIGEILSWLPSLESIKEVTLEANPEDITFDKIKAYADVGINRVSIGVQAFDDALLPRLGRNHTALKAEESVELVHKAGISNISIDLMYDLPMQTLSSWENSLKKAAALPITHLSLYNLTLEPHTVFFKKKKDIIPTLPSEETSAQMYKMAQATLLSSGFSQYEISAFARDEKLSLHNTGYWTGRPFIGYGPSAFSYFNERRFRNIAHLSKYCNSLEKGSDPVDFEEELSPEAKLSERFAIQLRLLKGVSLAEFSLSTSFTETLKELKKAELLQFSGDIVKLTNKGILFYDTVAAEII